MIKDEYLPLLKKVERPGRYTGGEFGCTYKDKNAVDLRMCFCFPDTYEIGMSNLGVKILMHCLNKLDFLWCERAVFYRYSAERGEDDPLVIGGGPCAYNPPWKGRYARPNADAAYRIRTTRRTVSFPRP